MDFRVFLVISLLLTIMIEFKRNGDNTIASNRIPVFVGEFVYDEEKESFVRNGRGYWIDEETRIAIREVEWKDEVEEIWSMDGSLACSLFLPSFSILMVELHCISYCFVNHIKTKLFISRIHRFHLAQNSIHR